MGNSRQSDDRESTGQALEHNSKCEAAGCPLAGSVSVNGGSYLCRYHSGAYSNDWPRITERINENLYQVMHLNKLRRGGFVMAQAKPLEYYHAFGNPKLNAVEGETHFAYEARFARYIWGVIREGLEPMKLEQNQERPVSSYVMPKAVTNKKVLDVAGVNS